MVWKTLSNESENTGDLPPDCLISTLGVGFFERGVCAVEFSFDAKYIAGVGCDDKHRIGIWDTFSGLILSDSVCQNGIPPQIKDLCWAPAPQYTGYISNTTSGLCDVFCSVGENHIKFWSFKRPAEVSGSSMTSALGNMNLNNSNKNNNNNNNNNNNTPSSSSSLSLLVSKQPRIPNDLSDMTNPSLRISHAKTYTSCCFLPLANNAMNAVNSG